MTDPLARIVKKMMSNRRDECINPLKRKHVNRRVLIRKRSRVTGGIGLLRSRCWSRRAPAPPTNGPRAGCLHCYGFNEQCVPASLNFLRCSGATDQQPHKTVDE